MSSTRLIIKNAEITPDGILIRSMEIIDGITGERIKPTALTPELLEFLKCVEIDIDAYFKLQELRKKNPAITELIQTFKLFT